jgi:hypothetical protein
MIATKSSRIKRNNGAGFAFSFFSGVNDFKMQK